MIFVVAIAFALSGHPFVGCFVLLMCPYREMH